MCSLWLSLCQFVCLSIPLSARLPAHLLSPLVSLSLLLRSLPAPFSALTCGFLTLFPLSSFLPRSFCVVIVSVLSRHQFVLARISFTSLVAAVNKFVSLFRFQIAGALLIFFCVMSTLPVFSRARGCAQVRI